MRCFLCKRRLIVASLSIKTRNQPPETVDEREFANFCPSCTALLFDACDASRRPDAYSYSIGAVDG